MTGVACVYKIARPAQLKQMRVCVCMCNRAGVACTVENHSSCRAKKMCV